MKKKITQTLVKRLKKIYSDESSPFITENGIKKYRYEIRDTLTKGFLIRVNKTRASYAVNYSRGKTHHIGYVDVKTIQEARTVAKNILSEWDQGRGVSPEKSELMRERVRQSVLTLGEFIKQKDGWGDWVALNRKSGSRTLQLVKTQFGFIFDKKLDEITVEDLDKWRTRRLADNKAASTVNRQINALRSVFALAEKWGRVEVNPLKGFGKLKEPSKGRVRYLSESEEKRLRASLRDRDALKREKRKSNNRDLKIRGGVLLDDYSGSKYVDYLEPSVLLSMNTGLRRGELMQLTWKDVSRSSIHVRAEVTKSGSERHIPLNKEAREIVSRWRKQSKGEMLMPIKFMQKAWERILKIDSKIDDFRWHDLRHHFASMLVMNGVPLNTVRELLGHSNIDMTIRYAHLAPEHLAEAVELIGERV